MASLLDKAKGAMADVKREAALKMDSKEVLLEVGETKLTATHIIHPEGKVHLIYVKGVEPEKFCCGLRSRVKVSHEDPSVKTNPLLVEGPNALELKEKVDEVKGALPV